MDRRDFLKKGALTLAGAIVGGGVISGLAGSAGCTPKPRYKRIGLQLYSLRQAMERDPEDTLKKVAAMGYTELETASYSDGKIYGYTPADFRTLVEGLGLVVTGCHVTPPRGLEDEEQIAAWWARAISDHKALGCRYVIMPTARLGKTLSELDALCARLDSVAAMAAAEGITFGYHNHSDEFKEVEGRTVYDYMLERTSPAVAFEMDVWWVKQGGGDPVDYLTRYAGRFPVLHIKDYSIIGDSGTVDFAPIFEAAYAQGMKDFFVEVEKYTLPAEICVEKSFDFLNAAPYVK